MDLELTDDQLELRASINAVLAKECPPSLARAITETGASTAALWATFVDLGWPALTVPDRFGGLGLGAIEAAVLSEELGRTLAATPLLATVTQFIPLVIACGDEQQQARWLGAVARGECRGSAAIAEATGSFDPSHTQATAVAAGAGWVLSGRKRFAFAANETDAIACTVAIDGAPRIVIVDTAAVTVTQMHAIDFTRSHCDVVLDGVIIADDQVLSNNAPHAIADALQHATLGVALETVGVCNSIYEITLEYVKQREQFGVPIGSFQAVKHKFADLVIALERARSIGYYAALCVAEHDDRRHIAVAAAKAAAGDAQRALAKEGIQLHGGIGYTWEHDMHLYVKRAKSNEQLFGTAAMHRAAIADLLNV